MNKRTGTKRAAKLLWTQHAAVLVLVCSLAFGFSNCGSETTSGDAAVNDFSVDMSSCGGGLPGSVNCPGAGSCSASSCMVCPGGMSSPLGTGYCSPNQPPPDAGQCFPYTCDGREDCTNGGYCHYFEGGSNCEATVSSQDMILCHADCDCPTSQPHCNTNSICQP